MVNCVWFIKRLKAMSAAEVMWRLFQAFQKRKEKEQFGYQRVSVTNHLFNSNLSGLVFSCEKLNINITNTNYELNKEIRLLAGARYSEYRTKWNAGFQTRNTWPDVFSYDLNYKQRDDIGDARTNWELNRHFQFAILAKNYAASGDKEYLTEFLELFHDWNAKNPFLWGISWTSVMEVAIRCSNWCYALAFLSITDAPRKLLLEIQNGILNMTEYVSKHYSRYSSANNHLIVEMYAIGQSGILFDNQEWIDLAIRVLTRELFLQNNADGVNKEASLHYQSFYMEAMGLMMRLLKKNNYSIPETWVSMLTKMSQFVADCTGEYDEVVAFGDDDEGKILDLQGGWTNHYQYVLGMMNVLLNKQYTEHYDCETLHWLFANDEIERTKKKVKYVSPQYCCYKVGGYSILRSIDRKVLIGIDHAELGYGKIAAHGHADALSFQLFYEGEPIFVDPGTYIYHCDLESRNAFRKTCNHNTVCINGKDQSEMLGAFLWGYKAKCELLEFVETSNSVSVVARLKSHHNIYHERRITFDGKRTMEISDRISKNSFGYSNYAINPKAKVVQESGNNVIYLKDNKFLLWINNNYVNKKQVSYSKQYGILEKTTCLSAPFDQRVNIKIICEKTRS